MRSYVIRYLKKRVVIKVLAFAFLFSTLLVIDAFHSSLASNDANLTTKKTENIRIVMSKTKRFIRRPWLGRQDCVNFTIQRAVKGSLPTVALASYPGSGNTWARYLIEAASGIYTGSVYNDVNLYFQGFWGELADWNSGETVVQKTHDSGPDHIRQFSSGKAIFLTRNPYDAVLSFHNFIYGGHTGIAPTADYNRPEWPDFFTDQTRRWLATAVNWTTTNNNDLLIVHYERLKEDTLAELRRILNFLQIPVNEDRLECIAKYPQLRFRRKSHSKKDYPIIQDRSLVDRAIRYVDHLVKSTGNPPLPLKSYNYYNNNGKSGNSKNDPESGSTSWIDWISDTYTQWGPRAIQSFVQDPMTRMMRQEAFAGAVFYSWRIPFESNWPESVQLDRDFNSGPPPFILQQMNNNKSHLIV